MKSEEGEEGREGRGKREEGTVKNWWQDTRSATAANRRKKKSCSRRVLCTGIPCCTRTGQLKERVEDVVEQEIQVGENILKERERERRERRERELEGVGGWTKNKVKFGQRTTLSVASTAAVKKYSAPAGVRTLEKGGGRRGDDVGWRVRRSDCK